MTPHSADASQDRASSLHASAIKIQTVL